MSLLTAYALPAALAWGVLGLLLNALPLRYTAWLLIVIYAAYFGITEATGMAHHRPPSSGWQVPQSFVLGRSRRWRILVWGGILGPGFATRNPYAGFGMLLLAVAAPGTVRVGVPVAVAIGIAHGAGRAMGLLRDAAAGIDGADYMRSVLKSMYWRHCDGLALLLIAGVAVTGTL